MICTGSLTPKVRDQLPFYCISAEELPLKEESLFVIVEKEVLDIRVDPEAVLRKVIDAYKHERGNSP